MKKIFIDKRITKSGKKSFLNVNTTLDLYKYITAVHNDNQIIEDTYDISIIISNKVLSAMCSSFSLFGIL